MAAAPRNIRDQVQQVAEYFAETLPVSEMNSLPHVPQWLSIDAQRWIKSHHTAFTDLVLAAHREFVSQSTG